MEIKLEQKVVAAYSALGVASGVLSNYFEAGPLVYAVLLPLAAYAASAAVMFRLGRGQKRSQLLSNSLVTFLLVWAVVWIFLYNL
ncbi:MAG: hypothetical protein ABIA12_00440 [Candidatus Aenigmatarchaeota archaeon]